MAEVRNTMRLIEESNKKNNARYDMNIKNIDDIQQSNGDIFGMIYDSFRFGYMQGMKATKAEIKKGGANG